MFCSMCGKENDNDAIFCSFCGTKIVKDENYVEQENQNTYIDKYINAQKKSQMISCNVIVTIVSVFLAFLCIGFIISLSETSTDVSNKPSNIPANTIQSNNTITEKPVKKQTRSIYSYDNLGRAGLSTFAYNISTAKPTDEYFYYYTNNTPFRLEVISVYPGYVIVSGSYIDSYFQPTKQLLIKTNRQYVNGEYLANDTYYDFIGIIYSFGTNLWSFQEVKVNLL